jgi:hypothetical protein
MPRPPAHHPASSQHQPCWARLLGDPRREHAQTSYLVISHVTADHLAPEASRQAHAVYEGASTPGVARSRERIARFFAGLDMVAPGLMNVSEWRPGHIGPPPGPAVSHARVGRKSSPGRPR